MSEGRGHVVFGTFGTATTPLAATVAKYRSRERTPNPPQERPSP
jgi:hypothetical protein